MTDKIDDGGPAFPTTSHLGAYSHGMSLRDWFAGQAPVTFDMAAGAACISGRTVKFSERRRVWAAMAEMRYEYADAMLAARSAK